MIDARFPPEVEVSDESNEPYTAEEDEIWQDLTVEDQEAVTTTLNENCKMQRLSYFNHSLQLVIKDGLKEASGLSGTLAKVSRTANLLHSGTSFKDCFESSFGDVTIPTSNVTRWNSTLNQVKAYVKLDTELLAHVLDTNPSYCHKENTLSSLSSSMFLILS